MYAGSGNMGINLSNEINVIANSFSVIQGNEIKNILDLIGTATGSVDAYTKTQTDNKLALKQDTVNWLSGDSSNKNTISTGQGLFTIAVPYGSTDENVMAVNGPNYPEALRGQISMFKKCVMINDLEVQGAISAGGLSVLTTGTGYMKSQTYSPPPSHRQR